MNKVFTSYAVGQIQRVEQMPNQKFVFTGSECDYRCEVTSGDEIYLLKHDGALANDILRSVDVENKTLILEIHGEVPIHSLMFIGV